MERYTKHAGLVALAVAGALVASVPGYSDVNTPPAGGTSGVASNVAVDIKSASEIWERLASLINSATSKNGFHSLVGDLEKGQRERIKGEHYKDLDVLNTTVEQFRKDFKSKYNEEFSFKSDILGPASIYQGGDKDHATVDLSAAFAALDQAKAHNGMERVAEAGKSAVANLVEGIKDLSMVKEPALLTNGWRLQIGGEPSAQQLSMALNSEITAMRNDRDDWPGDAKTAYLQTARHVFKALQDASEQHTPTASVR